MTYLNNDTEAFPMDDLGNRMGQVTQRDGVGKVHALWLVLTKNRHKTTDSQILIKHKWPVGNPGRPYSCVRRLCSVMFSGWCNPASGEPAG
ncbi:MAG TPA: hypothetical protein PKB02_06865 [Anaerohalosphaeraceae bacterium]|nr:hypothetical protein [Anaerohalosphaeraceae bacterium]